MIWIKQSLSAPNGCFKSCLYIRCLVYNEAIKDPNIKGASKIFLWTVLQ